MPFGLTLLLMVATGCAMAQQSSTTSSVPVLPDALHSTSAQSPRPETTTSRPTDAAGLPDAPSYAAQTTSHDASLAPPLNSSRRYLNLAAPNSQSLIFAGGPSPAADTHPQSDAAISDSGKNCAHDSADKTDGSGWFNSLLNLASRNQHYCALGEGGIWKRGTYAISRAFAAHNNDGANSFNASQFLAPGSSANFPGGNGAYQSYAYRYDAGQRMATRYATGVGRDALKNMFREFWPDVSSHVTRRRP